MTCSILVFIAASEKLAGAYFSSLESEDVFGGDLAWSGVVSLRYMDGSVCSGVLLGDFHVLTAAHCTEGVSPGDINVMFGSLDGDGGGVKIAVSSLAVNPFWDRKFRENDLAMIKLKDKAPSGWARIRPAKSGRLVEWGWHLILGYGYQSTEAEEFTAKPKIVPVSSYLVADSLSSVRISLPQPCLGDSGGPVLKYQGGEFVVVALVSTLATMQDDEEIKSGLKPKCGGFINSAVITEDIRNWIDEVVKI
jgi:secreted trypsin-like serine protease